MLSVREVGAGEQASWDVFVTRASNGSFLHAWAWGEFQHAAGFHIHRVAIGDGNNPQALALLVERSLPLGQSSLYVPWGPVIGDTEDPHRLRDTAAALRMYIQRRTGDWPVYLRIEPKMPDTADVHAALAEASFAILETSIQPRDTRVVDLTRSEDDLLKDMHTKTRYNIRVAIRHGVTVHEETTAEGLNVFWQLAQDVEGRGAFRYHPRSYYDTMLKTLGAIQVMFHVYVARHNDLPVAAGLFIRYGNTVTYAHGASTTKRAHVMAPTLLHWEAMLRSKAEGAETYDFFGVAATENPKHPWAGITRFKRGFGGRAERYIGSADAVFDPVRYRLFTIARGMRHLIHR